MDTLPSTPPSTPPPAVSHLTARRSRCGETDKVINDVVHGYMRFDGLIMTLVDTPEFQRLRDLNQLGACYYVFPGGSHHRFEHCLGVCYLAGSWMRKFQHEQPELGITDREVFLVQAAALCHDLGHGPFSHVWDNEFIPRVRPDSNWTHEEMSTQIFESMVRREEIAQKLEFTEGEIELVKALIRGDDKIARPGRKFLFMIVSNSKNSIDVDKFDYLARDGRNLNVPEQFPASRLLTFSRVIDDEICFKASEVDNIYDLFSTRYKLHKKIYSHRVAKAIEYMITDALVCADEVLHFSDAIDSVEEYLSLTDCILKEIEFYKETHLTEEEALKMREAKAIIQRLRRRDLYKFVDEVLLSPNDSREVTVEKLLLAVPHTNLSADDLIIHNMKINYGLKDKNPVDECHFYQERDPTKKFRIRKSKVSLLIPVVYQERYVRLYVRDSSKEDDALDVFRQWAVREGLKFEEDEDNEGQHPSPFSKSKTKDRRRRESTGSDIGGKSSVKRVLDF